MQRKFLILLSCFFQYCIPSHGICQTTDGGPSFQQQLSLDKGWRFHLGDIPFEVPHTHDNTYNFSKAGNATGAAGVQYDDRNWRIVDLPHDWAIESPFDSTENPSHGYHARGYGWYRRTFMLAPEERGRHLELRFDGIATNSTIWVNGTVVQHNWCGYTSAYIDVTPLARYGKEPNVIAVRVDAQSFEGWWYEGAGIYRHTWLVERQPLHIATDGIYAQPVKKKDGSWLLPAEVLVENSGASTAQARVQVSLLSPAGDQVATGAATVEVSPLHDATAHADLIIPAPTLWTLEHPVTYRVVTKIIAEGVLHDESITPCGFRTIRFTPDSGFFLNDRHLQIRGVCNHQDNAGVGVAVPDALWEYRIRRVKEMGANAWRCAHNPPSKEFLDACDSLGILVMDENRNFNTSPDYIRQLQWMVRRDRNHPSVILWSVFNEEPMQGTPNGYEMVRLMRARARDLDTTRPVTAAQSGGQFEPVNVSQAVDVVGFNYQPENYQRFHLAHPDKMMTSSEDVSGLMTRGEYTTDKNRHTVEAYDTQRPSWGATHRTSWKAIDKHPFLAGCFIWTAFDYRGEPTPYTWPSAGSFFGCMDQCGFPKTAFWIHQAQWRDDLNVLQLVPHWNWPADSIGRKIRVMVLSNADSIQVFLNGISMGGQPVDKYEMNTWLIPYQPGRLEAIGYRRGRKISSCRVETTGPAAALRLIPDRSWLNDNGADALPVRVEVVDKNGRLVPDAGMLVEFEIAGAGKIIGLANGDPNSHEPEQGLRRSLFNGLAQVILQSAAGANEPIRLTAKAKGLTPAVLTLTLHHVIAIPSVATSIKPND